MSSNKTVDSETNALRKEIAKTMPDNPISYGCAVYSQCDEDGIIRECLRRISHNTPLSHTFVEIGCADGLENNTHLLLLDGFRGVWIDADKEKIDKISTVLGGTVFEKLWIVNAMVSLCSAESLGQRAKRFLGIEIIDFLSLDIDGNDWHVLPAFLRALDPKLVCVEYNAKFPPPSRLVMRYNEGHSWGGGDYFGASLQSWVDLMTDHSYSLVCCNLSGANAFFVKKSLMSGFTCYPPEHLFQPPRYSLIRADKGHAPSLLWLKQCLHNAEDGRARFVPATLGTKLVEFGVHIAEDQFISSDILRNGTWEPFESKVFSRICRPGDNVLDLGANIGWYSALAARIVGESGSVIAFEPDEKNVRLLEMNVAVSDYYNTVEIVGCAVGDNVEEALFYKSDANLGDHRLFSDGSTRQASSVNVITLDSFFSSENKNLPNIVKSDTQGSEAKIIRGARHLLSKGWRPVMILEFWPFGLTKSGDDPLFFWQELIDLGYTTYEVSEGNPRLLCIDYGWLKYKISSDISPDSGGFINLLCIPSGSDRLSCLPEVE